MLTILPFFAFLFMVCSMAESARSIRINPLTAKGKALQIPCQCTFPSCSCCAKFAFEDPGMNSVQFACADLMFNQEDIGVRLKVNVAGRDLYDREVSVANPPPVCIPVPGLPVLGFCATLYEVRVNSASGNACLRLSFQILGNDAAQLDLQCLHLENGMLTSQPAQ